MLYELQAPGSLAGTHFKIASKRMSSFVEPQIRDAGFSWKCWSDNSN